MTKESRPLFCLLSQFSIIALISPICVSLSRLVSFCIMFFYFLFLLSQSQCVFTPASPPVWFLFCVLTLLVSVDFVSSAFTSPKPELPLALNDKYFSFTYFPSVVYIRAQATQTLKALSVKMNSPDKNFPFVLVPQPFNLVPFSLPARTVQHTFARTYEYTTVHTCTYKLPQQQQM